MGPTLDLWRGEIRTFSTLHRAAEVLFLISSSPASPTHGGMKRATTEVLRVPAMWLNREFVSYQNAAHAALHEGASKSISWPIEVKNKFAME
jgi:hypothetical protein